MTTSLSRISSSLFLIPLALSSLQLPSVGFAAESTFTDVPSSAWYQAYVNAAAEAGVVGGYKNAQGEPTGKFGPSDKVTLSQALKMAVLASGYPVGALPHVYPKSNHWAEPYLNVAFWEKFPYFTGTTDIDAPATRQQVAQIIAAAFKLDAGTGISNPYTDVSSSSPSADAILRLTADGIMGGDRDASGKLTGHFRPTEFINRAETAKIVMNAVITYKIPEVTPDPQTPGYTNSKSGQSATVNFSIDTTAIVNANNGASTASSSTGTNTGAGGSSSTAAGGSTSSVSSGTSGNSGGGNVVSSSSSAAVIPTVKAKRIYIDALTSSATFSVNMYQQGTATLQRDGDPVITNENGKQYGVMTSAANNFQMFTVQNIKAGYWTFKLVAPEAAKSVFSVTLNTDLMAYFTYGLQKADPLRVAPKVGDKIEAKVELKNATLVKSPADVTLRILNGADMSQLASVKMQYNAGTTPSYTYTYTFPGNGTYCFETSAKGTTKNDEMFERETESECVLVTE
jgi:hypothetical protein